MSKTHAVIIGKSVSEGSIYGHVSSKENIKGMIQDINKNWKDNEEVLSLQ